MEAERDFERLDPTPELDRLDQEEGSYLPVSLVDRQAALARRSPLELSHQMADIVISAALRTPATTPKKVLADLLEGYRISDEDWVERVSPELRRVLHRRGITIDERGNVSTDDQAEEEAAG
jgi:hypothetical protein